MAGALPASKQTVAAATRAAASAPATAGRSTPPRLASIDLIRGAVMILMAIDHVRVYAGVPAGGPDPAIFFTRWITHFCAPAFVFLAGTSAFFHQRRHGGVSRFLLTRGLWLIVLELTVLRVAWTFNLDMGHQMAGVIWAIGWSMIALALLARLPLAWAGAAGVVIMAAHNLLDPFIRDIAASVNESSLAGLWKILYVGFFAGPIGIGGGATLIVLYSLVPWIGVMAAGYAFGRILALEPARRDRLCLLLGLGAVGLFLVLRGLDLYGDPQPWRSMTQRPDGSPGMPAPLAFLNTTKYPASLQFLLMTLGPAIACIPLLERARGAAARWVAVFGRVPFFYYVLHIPLIHALALVVSWIRLGEVSPWLLANHPMDVPPAPEGYVWSLAWLYVVWAATLLILSVCCRWFAGIKARRHDWWLSYL